MIKLKFSGNAMYWKHAMLASLSITIGTAAGLLVFLCAVQQRATAVKYRFFFCIYYYV